MPEIQIYSIPQSSFSLFLVFSIPLKGFSRFQSRETLPKPDRKHAILWAEKQSEGINFRRRAQANTKALCERRTTSQTILTILDVYLGEFENLPILR